MSRYVVTGCAGFIGSHLAERLLARGDQVAGVDAFTPYYARSLKARNVAAVRVRLGFTFVRADLSRAPLRELLDGVDGVFHLAGQPGVRASWGESFDAYVRHNVVATQRVLEACAGAGVRVALASSSSVYGDAEAYPTREDAVPRPVSPYGVTKLACEHLAHAVGAGMGLEVVCLRYFSVYGPRQRPDMAFSRVVSSLLEGRPFPLLGSGAQVRDFTYVEDVVSATILAMERAPAGAVYNVGGGTPASLAEAIAICERVAGRRLVIDRRPVAMGDPARTSADTDRIRSQLGWRPQVSLADGLAAQVAAALPRRRMRRRPAGGRAETLVPG